MNTSLEYVSRAAAVAIAGMVVAAALTAQPASAAKASCADRPFQDRTRIATGQNPNVAGVVFRPDGDKFHIWDNLRDNRLVGVYYNYAGLDDGWNAVDHTVFDGGQAEFRENVRERRQICFQIRVKGYPRSPIVRYGTTPAGASSAAKPTCDERPFRDRTRVAVKGNANVAGVVFRPEGDKFHIWDNVRDGYAVWVDYNYSGIDDKWKTTLSVSDGAQGEIRHNLAERREICFRIRTDNPRYPNSPIVTYKTSP